MALMYRSPAPVVLLQLHESQLPRKNAGPETGHHRRLNQVLLQQRGKSYTQW